jgi:hypothetical protein
LDYATSGYNIGNRFVGTVTYALPMLDGKNFLIRQVLGGWQANAIVDLRSGGALNATVSTDFAHVNAGASQRPNLLHEAQASTCSRETVVGPGGSNHNSCLDVTGYGLPANGTFGNLQRNYITGPGQINTSGSIFKNFPIWETVAAQIRVEAFNIFNHPNPGNPNTSVQSASFGYITGAQGSSRSLQVAGKINF